MKKGVPCSHDFKCLNCKRSHTADSTNVHSGNTTSIENGIQRNMLISGKLGENQHTLVWVKQENDFKRPTNLFSKCLQEQLPNQYHPWNQPRFQHLVHPRTICCSNHSSLKDKWSYNKQSSPMSYQVKNREITRELDKEPLLHCSSIYINTMWSVLQQCIYLMSIHHASISRLPCFLHVSWCHTFNLHYICAHYVYTIRNSCPLTSSLILALHLDSSQSF